jgi:tRNA U34 5-methylaminomethyl-2-thiouridine-forming methyltransferase MnmC
MEIILTEDGSHTLFSPRFNEIYHSRHGALQESRHVFIEQGMDYVLDSAAFSTQKENEVLRILEIGFGTGLNALLTMLEADKRKVSVDYTTIELYPVPIETIKGLNYTDQLGFEYCYGPYHSLHLIRWNEKHPVRSNFSFQKINQSLIDWQPATNNYQLIYFDAFAPDKQPEMWTADIFRKMYEALAPGGILVTYCSKTSVQRAMKEAGLAIEKLPGAKGKREMIRAHKK